MKKRIRQCVLAAAALGLVAGVSVPSAVYAQDKPKAATKAKGAKMSKAAKNPNVVAVQEALKKAGFDPGPADGRMGKKTREAIKAFQKANGLKEDGKVGKLTRAKLMGN